MWKLSIVIYFLVGIIYSCVHYKRLNEDEYYESIEDLPYYDRKCIKGYIPIYLLILTVIWPIQWIIYLKKRWKKRKGT